MDNGILTVRELTEQLCADLEKRFPFIWVRGEVANLSSPASGHRYFTLKDQDAQLQCVFFRSQQPQGGCRFDPLTGEVYDREISSPLAFLNDGADVLCAGKISVYPKRGQYQLIVELMQPAGKGGLAQAFEMEKNRLAALGYFDAGRKRQIAKDPERIALVTSLSGAAIHDFLRIADERGYGSHIRIFPVKVQGKDADLEIAAALREINRQKWAQVIVLIRGGGSQEDLWTFNERVVADSVFHSIIPVLAGIGHEIDYTLADMTADVRVATPTHAAEFLWTSRKALQESVAELVNRLRNVVDGIIGKNETELSQLGKILNLLSPENSVILEEDRYSNCLKMLQKNYLNLIDSFCTECDSLTKSMHILMSNIYYNNKFDFEKKYIHFSELNPEKPLDRGYAIVYSEEGCIVKSKKQAAMLKSLLLRFNDGMINVKMNK
ncbi:MAG: exodeoxyribonuclease VII large subunit [Desulfovibrio sp.]|nr:exodeoxyribonuclease VII large subunit [Desulfovibrio sp.]